MVEGGKTLGDGATWGLLSEHSGPRSRNLLFYCYWCKLSLLVHRSSLPCTGPYAKAYREGPCSQAYRVGLLREQHAHKAHVAVPICVRWDQRGQDVRIGACPVLTVRVHARVACDAYADETLPVGIFSQNFCFFSIFSKNYF